jgi:hypothetical protein
MTPSPRLVAPPTPRLLALAATLAVVAACGQIGPPLAPLRLRPEPPQEMQVIQQGARLAVRYRAPRASVDGVRLPVLDVDLTWLAGEGNLKSDGKHVLRRVAPGEIITEDIEPVPPTGTPLRASALARSGKHASTPSAIVSHTVQVPPAAPTGVTAERTPAGVRIRWTADESARLRPYRRSEGETTPGPLITEPLPAKSASYDDVSPGAALAGCYTVRAVSPTSAFVESDDSPEACVVAPTAQPLEPPVGLAPVGDSESIDLSWSPSGDPRVVGYKIYRAAGDGSPELRGETEGAGTTFHDPDPPHGQQLTYTVTALDQDGSESAPSTPAVTRLRGQ